MKTGPVDPRTSKVIGVASVFLDNSFNATAFRGMHGAARARGYELLLVYATPRRVFERGVALRQVAGWIAMYNVDGLEELLSEGKPGVIFCAPPLGARWPVVRAENHDSIHLLVDHLVRLGHRRIAYIGMTGSDDFHERSKAFDQALRARGLEADLNLLSDFHECAVIYTEQRFQELLERNGKFCTALVAGNDEMAIGAINAIRAHGYRVPEDIAVVGFDDINAAQYCDPPLTTVRQDPALLGRMAVERLLDLLDGLPPRELVTRAPAELVVRRSCGSGGAAWNAAPVAPAIEASGGGWQRALSRQMNLVMDGSGRTLSDDAPLGWIEAEVIAQGLGAALAGEEPPDVETLQRAFAAGVARNDKIEVLLAVVKLVEQTAARRLAGAPDPEAARRLETFLDRVRLSQQRALAAWERRSVKSLERLVRAKVHMSRLLASKHAWTEERLEWLAQTSIGAGCIALWGEASGSAEPELLVHSVYPSDTDLTALVGRRYPASLFPPPALRAAALPDEPGGYLLIVPLVSAKRDWGTLVLGGLHMESFADNLHPLAMWVSLLIAAFEHHDMEAALHAERDMLAAAYERERALASTVRELGCPVIPLLPGVLLISLIGAIDAARAQQIIEAALSGVAREGARWVLLDVTGVPFVDESIAAALVQTAQATRLLGARVSLVGVGPRMAQGMVGLGIELRDISIFQSLAAAISELTRPGKKAKATRAD
ncbi:substrate-binding domain-containing protein [Sorangium sp. So ce1000]|uniref:substrate-binding domain-containing protein n=1 Tax=Sorangium sp. So ce1000 TaxID=3133325 RepID=UPI003F63D9E4